MPPERSDDRAFMDELRRRADEVCRMIISGDWPEVDVAIARARLREWVEDTMPEKLALYDMIYESRFDRLAEQFSEDTD